MNIKNNNSFLRNAFLYIVMIIAVVTAVQYFVGESQSPSQQLSYTQLIKKIEDGKVKSITYQPNGSIIEVKGDYKKAEKVDNDLSLPFLGGASSETQRFTSTVLHNETIIQALQSASEKANVNIKMIRESSSGTWISYLFSYLPLIGIAIFFIFMMNQGGNRGAMNFGRNRAKAQSKENIKVRFTDVAGAEEEKEELVEIVDFLKNPRKYKALVHVFLKESSSKALQEQVKPSLLKLWLVKLMYHSLASQVLILWRCLSVSELAVYVVCLKMLKRQSVLLSLLMKLMLLVVVVVPEWEVAMMSVNKPLTNC